MPYARFFFVVVVLLSAGSSQGKAGGGTGTGGYDLSNRRHLQTYTSNQGVKIVASINKLDQSGSNQKCIQFSSETQPESIQYTKACFTTLYSPDKGFVNCAVTIDDATQCDTCKACTTTDGGPGFELDCFSFHSGSSTNDQCVALNDENIQSVLLDDLFDTQQIEFVDAPTSASSVQSFFFASAAMAAVATLHFTIV